MFELAYISALLIYDKVTTKTCFSVSTSGIQHCQVRSGCNEAAVESF